MTKIVERWKDWQIIYQTCYPKSPKDARYFALIIGYFNNDENRALGGFWTGGTEWADFPNSRGSTSPCVIPVEFAIPILTKIRNKVDEKNKKIIDDFLQEILKKTYNLDTLF